MPTLYTATRGLLDLADAGVIYQDPQDIIAGDPWADQTAAVQAAYDMANDAGGGILVSGHVATRPIDNSGNAPTVGRGSGPGAWYQAHSLVAAYGDTSTLKDPFIAHGGPEAGKEIQISGLYLRGPSQNPVTTGVFGNVNAYGVNVHTKANLFDVKAHGFSCAISSDNDHQVYRDCDFGDNEIASIDFIERVGVVGVGDMQFDHCYFTANGIAGIIFADNAVLANVNFVGNGHIGLSPVGFLRYAADPTSNDPVGQVLTGALFQKWSFEFIRYAAMWDRGRNMADWAGLTFLNYGSYGMMAGSYTIPGWPDADWPDPDTLAIFEVGSQAIDWTFLNDMPTLDGRVSIRAENHIFNVRVGELGVGDLHSATANLLEVRDDVGDPFGTISLGANNSASGGTIASVRTAETTITRGDVVRDNDLGVIPFDNTRLPAGIAVQDAAEGAPVVITSQCSESGVGVRNTSGSGLARYDKVKPDPANPGGVVATTSISDAIGYVTETAGIADGAFGEACIQI